MLAWLLRVTLLAYYLWPFSIYIAVPLLLYSALIALFGLLLATVDLYIKNILIFFKGKDLQ